MRNSKSRAGSLGTTATAQGVDPSEGRKDPGPGEPGERPPGAVGLPGISLHASTNTKREPACGELVRFVGRGVSVLDHGPGQIHTLTRDAAKVEILAGGPIVGGVAAKKGEQYYFARHSLEATADAARFTCHCGRCEEIQS